MSVMIGVMIVVMVIGFFGFGHHHIMTGVHGKEKQEMMEHHNKEEGLHEGPEKKSDEGVKKDISSTEK